MLEKSPVQVELEELLGKTKGTWDELVAFVEENYSFEPFWDIGGKYGIWELKFRRSGKTLCAFYVKQGFFTVLLVYGKAEREKFEQQSSNFSVELQELYQNTHQYHDGKWLWIHVKDHQQAEELKKLIVIKKKPGKKSVK